MSLITLLNSLWVKMFTMGSYLEITVTTSNLLTFFGMRQAYPLKAVAVNTEIDKIFECGTDLLVEDK